MFLRHALAVTIDIAEKVPRGGVPLLCRLAEPRGPARSPAAGLGLARTSGPGDLRLGAALLGSELERKGANLLMRFDERRDLAITRNLLLQARDAYKAPR